MTVYARPMPPSGADCVSPRRPKPLANKTNFDQRVGGKRDVTAVGTPKMVRQLSVFVEQAQTGGVRKKKKRVGVKRSRYKEGITLIPPQREEWKNVYTVVIDMDETLLWHPKLGEVHGRPGAVDLLKGLKGRCETVLWTASTNSATAVALKSIGLSPNDFSHVITRDSRWFSWKTSAKDIRYLNRDPEKVIVIDNSPFSVCMNNLNGLVVSDFNKKMERDDTLFKVHRIVQDLISSQLPVYTYLTVSMEVTQKCFKLYPSAPPCPFFCLS